MSRASHPVLGIGSGAVATRAKATLIEPGRITGERTTPWSGVIIRCRQRGWLSPLWDAGLQDLAVLAIDYIRVTITIDRK